MTRKTTATERFKDMPCGRCGKPIRVGSNTRKTPLHVECGIQNAIDAARQLQERSGPHYDKWCQAMARRFAN